MEVLHERVVARYELVVEAAEVVGTVERCHRDAGGPEPVSAEAMADVEGSMARYQEWASGEFATRGDRRMEDYHHYLQGVGLLAALDHAMRVFGGVMAAAGANGAAMTRVAREGDLESAAAPLLERLELSRQQFRHMRLPKFWEMVSQQYRGMEIGSARTAENLNCPECGGVLIPHSQNPTSICDVCGLMARMYGDREESGKAKGGRSKHFNPNSHCDKHLAWMQGEEEYEPEPGDDVRERLYEIAKREYLRNGKQRSMEDMRCEEIREWLKRIGRTELNMHSPKLRQMVTAMNGQEVVPPRLTEEERDDVTADFSIAAELFEEVTKDPMLLQQLNRDRVKNHPFYPYILFHVLKHHIKDRRRMMRFVDCIHFQSTTTLMKNDHILRKIMERMEGYTYAPTRPSEWR